MGPYKSLTSTLHRLGNPFARIPSGRTNLSPGDSKVRSKLFAVAVVLFSSLAFADTLTVVSTADVFKPGGNTTFYNSTGGNPPSVVVNAGDSLNITATGTTSCGGFCPTFGPDGDLTFTQNSIPLYGIFLGNDALTAQPGFFGNAPDALTTAPTIGTVFFIGDGLTGTGSGAIQTFIVPTGATRLYFGFDDAPGFYSDNTGSLDVTVTAETTETPEPSSIVLLGSALLGAAGTIRRKLS